MPSRDSQLWRDLVAYWILGLTNNYGYIIMLSSAHDIIAKFNPETGDDDPRNSRMCHKQSTGTVLLADILPTMVMKFSGPFLPFWVNVRMFLVVAFSISSFMCVALANCKALALFGVVLTSASCGLGETTMLTYSHRFNKNVISTWSSGTGGAGIFGSFSYAALKGVGVSHQTTILVMLFVPTLQIMAFWILLRRPNNSLEDDKPDQKNVDSSDDPPLVGFIQKLKYALTLLNYIFPLASIYFLQYFINQGLVELVNFKGIFLDQPAQYRWLLVDYQVGVFVSRSTVNIYSIRRIWLLSIFQFINVVYFLFEVLLFITPSIWITFAIVFWEGLIGGGAYVNTFYNLAKANIPPARKEFSMGVVAVSDAIGITTAGFTAMPVHNAICKTAQPTRW